MANRKLGRRTSHRLSVLGGIVSSVIAHGQVETTYHKAKEAQRLLDSLVAMAVKEHDNFDTKEIVASAAKLDGQGRKVLKRKTSVNEKEYDVVERELTTKMVQVDHPSRLAARRRAISYLPELRDEDGIALNVVNKLFDELGARYVGRDGGYSRVIKLGPRRGDGAEVARLELLQD